MSQQLMQYFKISSQSELDDAQYNIQWILSEIDDFYLGLADSKHEKKYNSTRFTGELNIPEAKIEFKHHFIKAKQ